VADLLYHHAKFGGAGTSHADRGNKKFSVFFGLFFCPSRFWKDGDCERHITMKEFELRNMFGTVR